DEAGTSRGAFGTYAPHDRFTVAVAGGIVTYKKNGVVSYTSTVAPAFPLLVDTSLFDVGATIADVALSGRLAREVRWTVVKGVTATGSTLTKTAANGWNAGAISTRSLATGDGFVEFTAKEVNTIRIAGLSHGNTDTD